MAILEHVLLPVIPGREAEFEAAFLRVKYVLQQIEGFLSLRLERGIESPSTYLLLIEWDSVEAHEKGFRGSPQYAEWSAALHPFYDPFPMVEHFAQVATL
jgi:heme-degrading monooxygenase HmoA